MPTTADLVSLRPATDGDRELLLAVYGSTRADELAPLPWTAAQRDGFVRMQFDLQDRQYRQRNAGASFDVVQVDGVPAGRLYVDRLADVIRIIDISLLPAFRARGIGSSLIRAILDEAAASQRSVSLQVVTGSRARSLYDRLGFVTVALRGGYELMEWRAP